MSRAFLRKTEEAVVDAGKKRGEIGARRESRKKREGKTLF